VEVTCPQDTLAVGESMTCTGSTTATPGQYSNLGTACGDGADETVCDEDPSNHLGGDPATPVADQTGGKDGVAVAVSLNAGGIGNTLTSAFEELAA
jgi:hypothetical protein